MIPDISLLLLLLLLLHQPSPHRCQQEPNPGSVRPTDLEGDTATRTEPDEQADAHSPPSKKS